LDGAVDPQLQATEPDRILAGGGEMGARMRAVDWSRTPLGPVESWPQALKTSVRILLTSRQPMFVWWGEALINLYNDAYRDILGDKHPEALGQPAETVWREIWDQVGPRARSALLGNEGTYDEALLLIMERHGYAEETYYTFSYSPVPSDEGGIGGILCANTDDTQRIIGERQLALLRELAAATAEARTISDACARSARSLESNPRDLPFALLYLVERDQRRAILTGQANLAAGHPAAPESIGLDDSSVWPLATATRTNEPCLVELGAGMTGLPAGAWAQSPRQAILLPIPASGELGRVGVLVAGLNPYRPFDDRYRAFMQLVAGQIAAAIANAQAYEEERRRAEALAELDRAKTVFFSNVSHEFRTPLTLMLGPLEEVLAQPADQLPAATRSLVDLVHRNSLRLLKLVNSLLDFSRIEAGRVQASYQPTDLAALTADLASSFRSAIEKAGLRLILDCPPLPEPVYVDRAMWEKIVLNLLSNAFKFTFAGEIGVVVRPSADGAGAELRVHDTGTGIPAAALPRLFERFHRIEGARGRIFEGTGIGLVLVQELVKLHGGTVSVESELGQGTTFSVSVPFGRQHLPAERIGVASALAASAAAFSSTAAETYVDEAMLWLPESSTSGPVPPVSASAPRVLLVDDNADMRAYVQRLLEERYAVEAAPDGEAALAAARARPPDLVLSDVMMPGLDSFGLVAALRADPRTRDVPIILLSARAGEEAEVEGLHGGADDYLVKPFSARELMARVETHIRLARARTETTHRERTARLQAEHLAAEQARLRTELQQQMAIHVELNAALREAGQVRDRALAEAQSATQQLQEVFMQAPAAVAVLHGPEHVFMLANPRYMQLVGAQRVVIGKPVRLALPEVEDQGYFELLDRVYATGEPFVGAEMPVRLDRDGTGALEELFFNAVHQPLRNPAGRVTGIFVHAVDVTDQVQARQRLAESEERFRSLAASSPVGIFLTHANGGAVYTNAKLQEICGFSNDEALGQGWARFVHPEDREQVLRSWTAAVQDGRDWNEEIRFLHPDGAVRVTRSLAAPLYDAKGLLLGHVGAVEDVTERRQAREERRRARAERLQLEQQREEFLSAAAHDLRTPLASIQGLVQVLGRQLARAALRPEQVAESLQVLESSTKKAAALIDELLDISRLGDTGRIDLSRSTVDLVELATRVVADQQLATQLHRLHVETSVPSITGNWNAARLERAIGNLIGNAIKFSPAGGDIRLQISEELEAREAEGADTRRWAVISVQDQGVGIPAGELERIFARYHRGENVKTQIPGSGIGLAYVRAIAERHGGSITAASEEGRGSTFTLRLPCDP
jgi:PAS domain S-box-containing protein